MLVLTEVKGFGPGGFVDVTHAVNQLKNVMKAINTKDLADGVERVQLFVPKGSGQMFNGKFYEEAGQLFDGTTRKPVTLKKQGRPDLIVQVVFQ